MKFPSYELMSEDQHQMHLIQWCMRQGTPFDFIFAIPNGGGRSKVQGSKLKMTGVKPGIPDLFLPVSRNGFNGLFIELKAIGGRISSVQKNWLLVLNDLGYKAIVCEGWLSAKAEMELYLKS